MKIILTEDVDKLGKKGEIKEVKGGYARNFLLPKNLAEIATKSAIKKANMDMQKIAEKEEKIKEEAQKQANSIKNKKITIQAKAEKSGKLFGAISEKVISENIKKQTGTEIDPKSIELSEPIKNTGSYKVKVKFTKDTEASIDLIIKSK